MRRLTLWQAAAIAAEAGAALAVAVLVGVIAGGKIDERIGSGAFPVFTVTGALLGLASGVYTFVKVVRMTALRKE